MGDFYKLLETKLDKMVDKAIAEENQRYLDSLEGQAFIASRERGCGCECCSGGFCGGCGHAGCGRR